MEGHDIGGAGGLEEPINGGPGLLPALNDLDINDGQREEPRHHHRDGLAGVDTFEGLFKITEELSHHKFNIQDFVNIADPGPPRRHTESLLKNTMDSLNKDFSTDLLILASNILSRLQSLCQELSSQVSIQLDIHSLLHYDALVKVQQQLQDKSVYICVLGRYNVGKTTLINALLRDEILPVSINPETAVTLFIKCDDVKLEQSTVTTHEPRLIDNTNGSLIAIGKEQVTKLLTSLHRGIRRRALGKDTNDYLLKIHFPLLEVATEPFPYLVDTPGSNEEGEIHLQLLAEQTLHSAAAYIFVMKYDDIKNKEDYSWLKMIHERDPSILQSERLTVVVTHYDVSFQNAQSFISVKQLKETVAKTITNAVKIEVSEDIVIPVCGKWASDVRQCTSHSSGSKAYNDVQMSLMSIKSSQSDQGPFDIMAQIQSMGRDQVLEEVEAHSRIKELEERISLVATRLSIVWRNNIVGSCKSFLKLADNLFDSLLTEVTRELRDIHEQTQHATKVVEYHEAMLKSITHESHLLEDFRTAFDRDTNYQNKFKARVDQLLSQLKNTLIEKQKVQKYSIHELKKEINETFHKFSTAEIKRWFLQTKFENCQRLLQDQTQRISEKFGRFRAAAALVVEQGGIPQTLEMYLRGNDDMVTNTLDEQMEGRVTEIEASKLSEIITKTYWIRLKIPFIKANVLSGTIDELIEDRRNAIIRSQREFFADIKDITVLHFFKRYCSMVIKELTIFMKILEENREIEKLKELLERKKQIAPKIQRRQEYEDLRWHFSQLATRLDITSRHGNS